VFQHMKYDYADMAGLRQRTGKLGHRALQF